MKRFKGLAICCTVVLMLTGCTMFNENGGEHSEPEVVYEEMPMDSVDILRANYALLSEGVEQDDNKDTDNDGLIDIYEEKLGTDKSKPDTDGDGLTDYIEVLSGLNPNSISTDGVTNDSEVIMERTVEDSGCSLTIKGRANISETVVQKNTVCNVTANPGVASDLYELYLEGMDFESAELKISYDKQFLRDRGYNEDTLSIYQYKNDGTFERVSSVIDKENQTVSAALSHFSKYCICDSDVLGRGFGNKVVLVLDDSGSMYSVEDCEGSPENDVDFKRIDMAKSIVERYYADDYKFGLVTFRGSVKYKDLDFDTSKEGILQEIENIRDSDLKFDGTNADDALMKALGAFGKKSNFDKKTIILLSDGCNTTGGLFSFNLYDADDVINKAMEKNVSIIPVALGNEVDYDYLNKIAYNGSLCYASNADSLLTIDEALSNKLNNNLIDTDGDGNNDAILVVDNGFNLDNNAFAFNNFILKDANGVHMGQCYGLALFTQLYYAGRLKGSDGEVERHLGSGLLGQKYVSGLAYDLEGIDFFTVNSETGVVGNNKNMGEWNLLSRIDEVEQRYIDNGTLYVIEGDKAVLNPEFLSELDTQLVTVSDYEYKEPRTLEGNVINSKEVLTYNIDGVDESSLNDNDKVLYKGLTAINNMYSRQNDKDYIKEVTLNDDEGFQTLMTALNNGVCPIISTNGHAINGYKLSRDIEKPNIYNLYVYDNNDNEKENVLTITLTENKIEGIVNYAYKRTNKYSYTIVDTNGVFGEAGTTLKNVELGFDKGLYEALVVKSDNSAESAE